MRLTEKDEQYVGGYCCIGNPDIEWKEKAYSKLGNLEDIEDTVGIDLTTLFKALTQGIWVIVADYDGNFIEYFENYQLKLDAYSKEIKIDSDFIACVILQGYGKTWALTKEELL